VSKGERKGRGGRKREGEMGGRRSEVTGWGRGDEGGEWGVVKGGE